MITTSNPPSLPTTCVGPPPIPGNNSDRQGRGNDYRRKAKFIQKLYVLRNLLFKRIGRRMLKNATDAKRRIPRMIHKQEVISAENIGGISTRKKFTNRGDKKIRRKTSSVPVERSVHKIRLRNKNHENANTK